MQTPRPAEILAALRAHPWREVPALPGRQNHRRAGVLVPLRWEPAGLTCLLTVRPRTLREHGGEVSFPGGKPDAGDASLEATALREAREELGIEEAEVLGRLSSMPLYTSDYRLEPFVAAVPDAPLRPSPAEVAAVLEVPLAAVLAWPHIDAIRYEIGDQSGLSPVFTFGEHRMYGATANTFLELLAVLSPLLGAPVPPLATGRLTWDTLRAGFRP